MNYLDNILHCYEAKRKKYDDTILINTKGFASEATSSNIFLVKGKKILTPHLKSGILPGITRGVVIEIIKKYFSNRIHQQDIKPDDLFNADEIFLTNSILEIVPVVKLGKKSIGKGRPGAFSRIIRALYKMEVRNV